MSPRDELESRRQRTLPSGHGVEWIMSGVALLLAGAVVLLGAWVLTAGGLINRS